MTTTPHNDLIAATARLLFDETLSHDDRLVELEPIIDAIRADALSKRDIDVLHRMITEGARTASVRTPLRNALLGKEATL